jgi:hypothetical protein
MPSPVSPTIRPVVLSRIGQRASFVLCNVSRSLFSANLATKLISPVKDQNLSVLERSKQLAAWTAVDQHVKPEHRVGIVPFHYSGLTATFKVIGIGSGIYSSSCMCEQGSLKVKVLRYRML